MLELLLCLVVGVSDGDTLKVRCGEPGAYEQRSIRIAGIDAPEKAQPFGQRSRQALAELCFKREAAVRPLNTDRYGRTVASVSCQERDVAATQVQSGMAWVYRRYSKGLEQLYLLEQEARQAQRGLWVDAEVQPPWEFRKRRSRALE